MTENTTAPALVEGMYQKEREVLKSLYQYLEPGKEERDFGAPKLATMIGIHASSVGSAMKLFESLGILTRRLEYGTPANGLQPGRHYHYLLLKSEAEATTLHEQSIVTRRKAAIEGRLAADRKSGEARRGKSYPKDATNGQTMNGHTADATIAPEPEPEPKVALATRPEEETRAIAGDVDTTLRGAFSEVLKNLQTRDESYALVEAARQYAQRATFIRQKIGEFEAVADKMGISFDRDKFIESLQFREDERLDHVRLVLPYINRLEDIVERQGRQLADQRVKIRDYDQLKSDNTRLTERNRDLVSKNAVLNQRATAPGGH